MATQGRGMSLRRGLEVLPDCAFRELNQLPNIDGIHSSSADGLHSQIGILVSTAEMRFDSDPPGGFEEDIRGRFLASDIFTGHHGFKELPNFQTLENIIDDVAGSAGGNGHRKLAEVIAGDDDNFVDWPDVRHQFHVFFLLFLCHNEGIDAKTLFISQDDKNVARGYSTEGVKAVFGKVDAVPGSDGLPRAPMQRHRVSQGAIAIEY